MHNFPIHSHATFTNDDIWRTHIAGTSMGNLRSFLDVSLFQERENGKKDVCDKKKQEAIEPLCRKS